jgi:hypothetical protein
MSDKWINERTLKVGNTWYEVRPHPFSKKHTLFVVTSRERVYACVGAETETKPTPLTVRYLWKQERH